MIVVAIGHVTGTGPEGVRIVQLAMLHGEVGVEGEEIGEGLAYTEQRGTSPQLLAVIEYMGSIQEDGVTQEEVLQRHEVHGEVYLLLQNADRPEPGDLLQRGVGRALRQVAGGHE